MPLYVCIIALYLMGTQIIKQKEAGMIEGMCNVVNRDYEGQKLNKKNVFLLKSRIN